MKYLYDLHEACFREDGRKMETKQVIGRLNDLTDEVKAQSIVIKGYQERNEKLFKENQKLKNEISQLQAYNSACEDTLLNVDVTLHQMITKAGNEHDKKFKAAKIHNSSSDIKDIEKTSMLLDTVFYWEGYLKALKYLKNEIFPKDVQK